MKTILHFRIFIFILTLLIVSSCNNIDNRLNSLKNDIHNCQDSLQCLQKIDTLYSVLNDNFIKKGYDARISFVINRYKFVLEKRTIDLLDKYGLLIPGSVYLDDKGLMVTGDLYKERKAGEIILEPDLFNKNTFRSLFCVAKKFNYPLLVYFWGPNISDNKLLLKIIYLGNKEIDFRSICYYAKCKADSNGSYLVTEQIRTDRTFKNLPNYRIFNADFPITVSIPSQQLHEIDYTFGVTFPGIAEYYGPSYNIIAYY